MYIANAMQIYNCKWLSNYIAAIESKSYLAGYDQKSKGAQKSVQNMYNA